MMEEVSTEDQLPGKMADAKVIEDELQEAAQTNVTQALPPSKEGTPPRTSVAPATSSSPMVSSLPPPSALPPQLSTPGGLAPTPPSLTPSLRGTTPPPPHSVGTLDPSTQISTTQMSGVAVGTSPAPPPPMGGFVPGRGISTTPVKPAFNPVAPATTPTGAAFVPSSISTLPSVGSSPSSEQHSVAPPPAYNVQPPVASTLPPDPTQPPQGASSTIDFQDEPIGPIYPSPEKPAGGLFGWFSGRNIVNKVMEKTKSSVETMITTLDPGMKEVIYSGGDVSVVVASSKEVKVAAVRQAFQEVFGRATVTGIDAQPSIAPQPVGYTAGLKGAEDRIDTLLRQDTIDPRQVTVAIESFIAELLPDKWYDVACLVLRDSANSISLQTFSQATAVPLDYVERAQEQTPADYSLRWSGLAVTVGQVINQQMPFVSPSDWHQHFTGTSRRDLLYLAVKSLAGMYKSQLPYQVTPQTQAEPAQR